MSNWNPHLGTVFKTEKGTLMDLYKRNVNKLRRRGQMYYNRGLFSLAVNLWVLANRMEREARNHFFPNW